MDNCKHLNTIKKWNHSILNPQKWMCYVCGTTESVWVCIWSNCYWPIVCPRLLFLSLFLRLKKKATCQRSTIEIDTRRKIKNFFSSLTTYVFLPGEINQVETYHLHNGSRNFGQSIVVNLKILYLSLVAKIMTRTVYLW